ncbi:hypothetical protein B5P44_01245 [Mycobacterium sp. CBMA 213]|uniref:Uncharacterized protein n=1 Tax=Mycolicibacterium sp. CBMA 213 TaxID=1968788 RepID=A0A343VRP4_9MYCO|nr:MULTISPECIES: hypothetical protein [unclassified Mycolicibacterium]AVN58568.1 hypothetical protein B5P44_p00273 [Mycolicibacterium sp. CBMA 213]MUL61209.1 hypothetical protein [Mycolicibacterium sp. CBMA 335]MUM03446.1 hypothetical protein [Mycolicibacterium sp. CBMA 213]
MPKQQHEMDVPEGALQLDLFGEFDAAERADHRAADAVAISDAAFDELVRTQTVNAAAAEAAGIYNVDIETTVRICPACGGWEPNEMLMGTNHGISRHYLVQLETGEWANGGMYFGQMWCLALELTASHATYGDRDLHPRQYAMIARLRPEVRESYDQEVAARPHRCAPMPTKRATRTATS